MFIRNKYKYHMEIHKHFSFELLIFLTDIPFISFYFILFICYKIYIHASASPQRIL